MNGNDEVRRPTADLGRRRNRRRSKRDPQGAARFDERADQEDVTGNAGRRSKTKEPLRPEERTADVRRRAESSPGIRIVDPKEAPNRVPRTGKREGRSGAKTRTEQHLEQEKQEREDSPKFRPTIYLSEEYADEVRRAGQQGGQHIQPRNPSAGTGAPSFADLAGQARPRKAPNQGGSAGGEQEGTSAIGKRELPKIGERTRSRRRERPTPERAEGSQPDALSAAGSGAVKGEQVKERILEATYACVARWGISKTTVEDAARQAGVSRATVYRYFPGGRDELVSTVISWEYARFFTRLYHAVQNAISLEEVMERGLMFARRSIVEHEVLQRVLETEPEVLLPNLTVEAQQTTELIAEFLLPYLVVHGVTPGVDPREAAEFLARMVLSYISSPGRWDLTDSQQVSQLVRAELLAGMVQAAGGQPRHSGPAGEDSRAT